MGRLEVLISGKADASGKFTVSAKQLVGGNIRAFINVVFGSEPNSTRLNYNTQDRTKTWLVNGSQVGDIVTSVEITIIAKE